MSVHLWPYALRTGNEVLCACNKRADGKSALELFAGSDTKTKMDIFRPFGCPIYALDNHLQAGQKIPKWHKRARLGIYLGLLPKHAKSVALALNLQTGLVLPQFHTKCDNLFETVNNASDDSVIRWQYAARF